MCLKLQSLTSFKCRSLQQVIEEAVETEESVLTNGGTAMKKCSCVHLARGCLRVEETFRAETGSGGSVYPGSGTFRATSDGGYGGDLRRQRAAPGVLGRGRRCLCERLPAFRGRAGGLPCRRTLVGRQ
jgi:hypothetical protein